MLQPRPSPTTDDLLRLWEREMEARRLTPKTIHERLRFVRYIENTLGPAAELSEDDIRDCLEGASESACVTIRCGVS